MGHDTEPYTALPCKVTGFATPPAPNCFADTTDYRLRIDGEVAQTQKTSINVDGTLTFTVKGGLPGGTHAIVVEAVGPG
jgi:hypothetical protein